MVVSLLVAFALAAVLSTAFAPAAMWVARRTGFVDHPSSRKLQSRAVPYLGGVAIALAVVISVLALRGFPDYSLGLLLGAAVLGTVGGIDDRHPLPASLRLAAETCAAVLAVVGGVRIQITGVEVVDVLLTVVWIVGVTNAVNLVDNMDGLAGGLAAITGLGIAVVGGLQGQAIIGVAGAATAGACGAFLYFNWAPARLYMGDLGALFLGFLLAVLTIELEPAIPRMGSEVVPVLLLAVPIFDTATVVVGRMTHGLGPLTGGTDHLSHRLARRLGSKPGAVTVLLGIQAICAILAVLIGVGVVNPWLGSGAATMLLLALGGFAWPVRVYAPPSALVPAVQPIPVAPSRG